MKKFTLLIGALCAVMTAGAVELSELTMESIVDLRLTAEELMQVEGSRRIAIRCTQKHGNQNTFFNGSARVNLPFTEAAVFDWESTGEGTYYIKKAFADENAYMQTANITTFGAKDASTVAKFTAVYPDGFTSVDVITSENEPNAEDYYLRLSLGSTWFNFNGNQYNSGTGVWTVQNVIDLSSFYKLTINLVKDGETTTTVKYMQVGDVIKVPVYGEYLSDYEETTKTADDNQVITVNYSRLIDLGENAQLPSKIVDGAVISLQCKDDNGGFDYYFNGAGSAKTAAFQRSNLFKVVAVDPSAEITQSANAVTGTTTIAFYLQQLTTEKYVGKSGDAVSAVDNKEDAAQFIAYIPKSTLMDPWTTKPAEYTAGINTIRFETSSTYLNCQPKGDTPKYAAGKGGYSYWFVNTYSEAEVEEIMGVQTDVVYNFPDFAGHALSMTVKGDINGGASDFIPSVPFFAATGVEGDNSTITAENNQFTVTGTWSFPFADKEVYRIDIRKKSSEHGCSNLFYNAAANKINTRNGTDAEAFVAERLFYLDAKGFTSDGNLKVTLHSIAADETHGFQAASTGGAGSGSYSDTPTELLVVTNNTGNEGISLQHPEDANAHVNDISGELGVWNNAGSKNDLGSFLRFGSLTDSDFDELMSSEIAVFITPELLEAAKATKGAAELRALFDAAAPYYAAVAEAEALIASISNYTAEHFGEDLGYFYGTDYASIAALVPPLQTALEGTDIEAIAAATEELAAEVAKVKVHLPEAGKFYVFKGVEGGWYITPSAATGQMVMTAEHTANSVFRFGEVEGEENAFVPFNVVYQTGITGSHSLGGSETYTFYPSQSGVIGAFSIQSNATGGAGTWVYNHYDKTDGAVVNRYSAFHERCNWYLEEVNEDGTGIEEITFDAEGVKGIYDLQGRRLSAPVKGINIINGKKVLVK